MNKEEEYRDWEETLLFGPHQAPVALLYTETLRLIRCIHDSFIKNDLPVAFRNFPSPLSPAAASLCRFRSLKTHKILYIGTVVHRETIDAVLSVKTTGDFARRKSSFCNNRIGRHGHVDGNVARVGEQPKHLFFFWLDDDIMVYIDDIGGNLRWRDDLEEWWRDDLEEWWK